MTLRLAKVPINRSYLGLLGTNEKAD